MNRIDARVESIKRMENLTLVHFSASNQTLQMIALGLRSEVKVGSLVTLGVKSTNITLAKDLQGSLSTSNRVACVVKSVENGELLSSVELAMGDTRLEALITQEASLAMGLRKNDKIEALIKASDLSIFEVKGE